MCTLGLTKDLIEGDEPMANSHKYNQNGPSTLASASLLYLKNKQFFNGLHTIYLHPGLCVR